LLRQPQSPDQPLDAGLDRPMVNEFCITTYQSVQIVWQLSSVRDCCAIEHDRYNRYPTGEPLAHLDPHEVIGVL
jgi:hypothetical protein